MHNNIKLFPVLLLLSGMYWPSTLIAASVSWQLTFFDESGQLVGDGRFNYNPETITCIAFKLGENCSPAPFPMDVMEVYTQIDSISINLADLYWGVGSARRIGVAWWYDPAIDVLPGWQLNNKAGTHVFEDQWLLRHGSDSGQDQFYGFAGDTVRPFLYKEALSLDDFTIISQSVWAGSWDEHDNIEGNLKFHEVFGYIPDMNMSQGTFKAELINTEVPIPGALVLFISSLFVLGFKRRKPT